MVGVDAEQPINNSEPHNNERKAIKLAYHVRVREQGPPGISHSRAQSIHPSCKLCWNRPFDRDAQPVRLERFVIATSSQGLVDERL